MFLPLDIYVKYRCIYWPLELCACTIPLFKNRLFTFTFPVSERNRERKGKDVMAEETAQQRCATPTVVKFPLCTQCPCAIRSSIPKSSR